MKNIIGFVMVCSSFLAIPAAAQILSTSNKPSQVYPGAGSVPEGPSIYGVFVGRTPCAEFLKALHMERAGCIKRKMSVRLYHDSITHQPTFYETHGMGKYSGKGKWQIMRGRPGDPEAIIFQLVLDQDISLYFLKGDDNVLFILDEQKNFLIGNANFSYTMNRARN
jgi:hypothetical protein